MIAKLTLTTKCGAHCITCPSWKQQPKEMSLDNFKLIWDKLNDDKFIKSIVINNTGDMYYHTDLDDIFDYIENNKNKFVLLQTNGSKITRIPKVDKIVFSFNGTQQEDYEKITGLSYGIVVQNIKAHYEELKNIDCEIHHLSFSESGASTHFLKLWKDFPGIKRISYKYDNQGGEDKTIPAYQDSQRVFCDYLNTLSILPDGAVNMCAHDWGRSEVWGNIIEMSVFELMRHEARQQKCQEHWERSFSGICENCNYNISTKGKIFEY